MSRTLLIAGLISTGLMAGLYFAFTCAVMPGLARADDRTFIAAMQRINAAIQNPAFFICFVGAFVFPAVAAILEWRGGHRSAAVRIGAASVLYLMTLLVTIAVNVPLNNALDRAGAPDQIADPAAVRRAFESVWVPWNTVRTVLSTLALAYLGWAWAMTLTLTERV